MHCQTGSRLRCRGRRSHWLARKRLRVEAILVVQDHWQENVFLSLFQPLRIPRVLIHSEVLVPHFASCTTYLLGSTLMKHHHVICSSTTFSSNIYLSQICSKLLVQSVENNGWCLEPGITFGERLVTGERLCTSMPSGAPMSMQCRPRVAASGRSLRIVPPLLPDTGTG